MSSPASHPSVDLHQTLATLRVGANALLELSDQDILDAWGTSVAYFRDPDSPERRKLDPLLRRTSGLSRPGLEAGLDTVLGGVDREAALALAHEAQALPPRHDPAPGPIWVVLASNIPGLAVQPLLPALLRRYPVLLKSASAESAFAKAWVDTLVRHEPRLRSAVAALAWPGGDPELEAPLVTAAHRVIAYGGDDAMAALQRNVGERLVAYGPKISLAVVGNGVDPASVAPGLARDIALFDQRGCLSIQTIYTAADAHDLAEHLAQALDTMAKRWPPGSPDEAAAVARPIRDEALMRGLHVADLPAEHGTVVVEPHPELVPSPGGRLVRIHPLDSLDSLPQILTPWTGKLQGAALVGQTAWALESPLCALGISRLAAPGDLQSPDVLWHNGGHSPLAVLD